METKYPREIVAGHELYKLLTDAMRNFITGNKKLKNMDYATWFGITMFLTDYCGRIYRPPSKEKSLELLESYYQQTKLMIERAHEYGFDSFK